MAMSFRVKKCVRCMESFPCYIIHLSSQYLLEIGFYTYQSALHSLPYYLLQYPCHGFFYLRLAYLVASSEAIKSLKVFLLLVVDYSSLRLKITIFHCDCITEIGQCSVDCMIVIIASWYSNPHKSCELSVPPTAFPNFLIHDFDILKIP